jgi:hypothetical protein
VTAPAVQAPIYGMNAPAKSITAFKPASGTPTTNAPTPITRALKPRRRRKDASPRPGLDVDDLGLVGAVTAATSVSQAAPQPTGHRGPPRAPDPCVMALSSPALRGSAFHSRRFRATPSEIAGSTGFAIELSGSPRRPLFLPLSRPARTRGRRGRRRCTGRRWRATTTGRRPRRRAAPRSLRGFRR